MKKILILYGSYGGGHLSAAKTIESYLNENYDEDVEVEVIDCIEYINKYLNKVSTEAYKELAKKAPWAWKHVYKNSQNGALSYISNTTNKLMSHKLNQLLQDYKPDLIVSTHPFATQMCAILKKKNKINCKIATILTDYHIHAQWLVLYEYVDYYFVANEQMKQDMIEEGVLSQKIFVTGIPVSERFLSKFNKKEICQEFGLSPDKKTVLFFAGGEFGLGRNSTFMTLKVLIRLFKQLQIVAISGKNKKMNAKFKNLVEITQSEDRVKILEYTNKVPELMHISDAVITKAGGLTITECLTSHLPIIIMNPIPGQEEENADFLVNNNVAVWIKKDDSIARSLKTLSKDTEKLEELRENAKALAKPKATEDICKILVSEFDEIKNITNEIVVSALVNYKNKYLFIKNDEFIELPNFHLNINETPEKAIKHNFLKEFNLKLENLTSFNFDSKIITYKKKKYQVIFLIYTATVNKRNNLSNDKVLWLSKKDFSDYKQDKLLSRFLKNI